jgi:ABC-2 type transport system permease protein
MLSFYQAIANRYGYSFILLKELVLTDFKLRYQGSALGYMWSLLKPLALFIILYVVFSQFLSLGRSIENYPVYLLLGIVLWTFFSEVTSLSVKSIVDRSSLIRKINFPKYIIVLSTTLSAIINLCLNLLIVGVFMILSGIEVSLSSILLIPLLLELFILSLGVAFLLSSLYVRFRDVNYVWDIILQGAFYATPIIYPLTLVPEFAAKLLMLNPVAQIIQDARSVLTNPDASTLLSFYNGWIWYLVPLLVSVGIFIIGALVFKKQSPKFAEEV